MEKNKLDPKILIAIIGAFLLVLVPLGILAFSGSSGDPAGNTLGPSGTGASEQTGGVSNPTQQSAPPTNAPTDAPTGAPTEAPTVPPTERPTEAPTEPTKPVPDTSFKIVENGVAKATIVIAKNYSQEAYNAAVDLQAYLKKMSGASVPIGFDDVERGGDHFYILVGPSRYTTKMGIKQPTGYPKNEKVIMKRDGHFLALLGNDDGAFRGTEFAVTMFLEKLGCGWFGTRELWQVVPSKSTITIDKLDVVHTPKFISRENRLFERYPELAKRWYLGGVEAQVGEHFMSVLMGQREFANHPEWYATRDGKLYLEGGLYWQYCYSNRELANAIGDLVIKFFDDNPNCYIYSITPNDGWVAGTCECSNCARYNNDADLIVFFANNVARRVATKYPDRKLSFLSYHSTLKAPDAAVRVEPNVEIMFCAETSMTRPIDKADYIGMSGTKEYIAWKDNFKQYVSQTGVKNISVWKWLCVAADKSVWKDIPWVQGNVAINDQNFWKSNGASYVFYDQGPLNAYWEYENSLPLRWPLWYVAAKGCWDASLTGDQILKDACDKLYGKASDAMFAYYKALANASESCKADSFAWSPPEPAQVYTKDHIQKIDAAVAAAEAQMNKVSDVERQRMENQLDLWKEAKKKI